MLITVEQCNTCISQRVLLLTVLAAQGVIPPLVELLESELEDVLVNAVNAVRVLCEGNAENQTEISRNGNFELFVMRIYLFEDNWHT